MVLGRVGAGGYESCNCLSLITGISQENWRHCMASALGINISLVGCKKLSTEPIERQAIANHSI